MSEKNTAQKDTQLEPSAEDMNVAPGFGSLASFKLMHRAAQVLAQSTLVPKEYQGTNGLANCMIALNMASRMGADPLMVMQNLYIVYGRPGWSSQFLISTFNTSGKYSALRYEWVGTPGKDDWGCRACAIEKSTGERLAGSTVTIQTAKTEGWYSKNGSKWQTMPEQMLMYRAASWFIRAYAPELAMGMHTAEELAETVDLDSTQYAVTQEIKRNANADMLDITTPEPEQAQGQSTPEKDGSGEAEAAKDAEQGAKEQASKGKPVQQKLAPDGPGF